MKRSSGDKSIDLIEISDDESPSKEPPQKTVKKDSEQFASQAILGMQQHLAKLDKDYQGACRLAAEAQKRVAFLENLLDKKPDASEDTEKEELKKRISELNGQLAQLEEETLEKIQSKNKLIENLQKKIAETSAKFEKEKNKATSSEEQLKRLAKLEKDYQGIWRIANEYEMGMNEAKARVIELEDIIDKKPMIAPVVVDNKDKNLVAELQTKLAEASTQLKNERSKCAIRERKLEEMIAKTLAELEKEKSKATSSEEQLKRLAKLEKDYQGVCRIAAKYEMSMNEAKARVMELENIIDKKPIIAPVVVDDTDKNLVAELQTKLAETSTQLKNERSKCAIIERKLQDRIARTPAELEKEKCKATSSEEQLKRLNMLERDYQSVRRIAADYERGMKEAKARVMELENIIHKKSIFAPVVADDREKNLVAELQKKLAETSNQLEKERSECARRERKSLDNIRSLTQQLKAEKTKDRNGEIRIEQSRLSKTASGPSVPAKVDAIQRPVEPKIRNLFEPCSGRESSRSLTFESAHDYLCSKYHPCNSEWRKKWNEAVRGEPTMYCITCNKEVPDMQILDHFFSKGHTNKMRARNSAVSRSAFDYWMAKLESIPKSTAGPATTSKVQVATVAPTVNAPIVSPKVVGALSPFMK